MKAKTLLLTLAIFLTLLLEGTYSHAQSLTIDLGKSDLMSAKIIQLIGLITILSIAPSILIMVTSFTKISVVLSFVRTAVGLQQTPPNPVIISLALFLTFFIMAPTFEKAYENGLYPLMQNTIKEAAALQNITNPFRDFMLDNVREKDLSLFSNMARLEAEEALKENIPLHVLIPAFMISELKKAFEIGFLIFLPFLVIDMLVSSILMAMGMMMLPPVVISLPFKIIFFVLIDGWYMLCGSLVKSYGL
ncbi:MAG: flagellar type III secretion system pore protein FliP [Candidatus Midichloria mitochondrii]|nr:flagellar type III secretion system pore protein FliP [Candidatus Midichloria mitochondrii]MDJ1256016.1 flagellar type III secretion system pore protein FliP [Candidatus Midichloria mitochondrii]MDJ1287715.1 flagellar type III secretion system pore protein FliP [Candidatus Midichloria mitochondrii]MDJ1298579.1 flagellar type III secretion system pore protein FliP [Candidatus Midichloria mitochondrii]MDJ1312729.1 flagellar type III secretion system pore protein FliP [Candidatus Midichloria mi